MIHKRKIAGLLVCIFLACAFMGCDGKEVKRQPFSVKTIAGESISPVIINLPNGKVALINGGAKKSTKDKIILELNGLHVKEIDYLFITSPLDKNVKNLLDITKEYKIKSAYLLNISNESEYAYYDNLIKYLSAKGTEIKRAFVGELIQENGAHFTILSPLPYEEKQILSYKEIASISPSIYLDYFGLRFMFMGESDNDTELELINSYTSQLYEIYYKQDVAINLSSIDYLCFASQSVSMRSELLSLLKPKNIIVSFGITANTVPLSTAITNKLYQVSPEINMHTCSKNDFSVLINKNGSYNANN